VVHPGTLWQQPEQRLRSGGVLHAQRAAGGRSFTSTLVEERRARTADHDNHQRYRRRAGGHQHQRRWPAPPLLAHRVGHARGRLPDGLWRWRGRFASGDSRAHTRADAGADTGSHACTDPGADTGSHARTDAGADPGADTDAHAGAHAGTDASPHACTDASAHARADAGSDAGTYTRSGANRSPTVHAHVAYDRRGAVHSWLCVPTGRCAERPAHRGVHQQYPSDGEESLA
jgi:hypothetical protein